MKNRYFKISVIIIFIMALKIVFFPFGLPTRNKVDPLCLIADQIINSEAALLSRQYQMKCCTQGHWLPGNLKKIRLGFNTSKKLSKDEGKIILLNCVSQIVRDVNSLEEAKPFFENGTFDENNVEITLYCKGLEKNSDTDISSFSFENGNIYYFIKKASSNQLMAIEERLN